MPVVIVAAAIAAAAALIGAAIASGDMAKAQAIRAQIAKQAGEAKLPTLDKLVAQKLTPEAACCPTMSDICFTLPLLPAVAARSASFTWSPLMREGTAAGAGVFKADGCVNDLT